MTVRRSALPDIPVIELGEGPPADLVEAAPARVAELLAAARRDRGGPFLALGDRLSRRWLVKAASPYLGEIEAVAARLSAPGAWFLNLSHEWGCTTAVAPAPGGGPRLLRALDWPLDGLGRNLLAARRRSRAGRWIDLTWPGLVGVVQALAPGRFAAAFNQAPLGRRSGLFALDWLAQKSTLWRRRALPPAHLLRRVFEAAADYEEARDLLIRTPLALPVIFTIAGVRPGEGCVIERREDRARVRQMPCAAANHWLAFEEAGHPRGIESIERCRALTDRLSGGGPAWFAPPVLNALTRVVFRAEPARGRLTVQGYEAHGPATAVLELDEAVQTPSGPREGPPG